MVKRTLYFGSPAYLCLRNAQVEVHDPGMKNIEGLSETIKKEAVRTIPVEDTGVVILDHAQITVTQPLMAALLENNVAVIWCDAAHHPSGLLMVLSGHHVQQEKFRAQINASEPLKKNLWQQTVKAKIANQAAILKQFSRNAGPLQRWAADVRSGDPDNYEARAAVHYWQNLFPPEMNFYRKRDGIPPNNLLNYGYAVLRAIAARSLVGSGLLPTLGIHHHNRYNAYCLADDIMEPFRPFVDRIVVEIVTTATTTYHELTKELIAKLLGIASVDILMEGERSPLMVGMQRTTASLPKCFEGEQRKIIYPEL